MIAGARGQGGKLLTNTREIVFASGLRSRRVARAAVLTGEPSHCDGGMRTCDRLNENVLHCSLSNCKLMLSDSAIPLYGFNIAIALTLKMLIVVLCVALGGKSTSLFHLSL